MKLKSKLLVVLLGWLLSQQGATAAEPVPVEFQLRIENNQLVQGDAVLRVSQGDQVRLRFRSDRTANLHLHGYDIETTLVSEVEQSLSFSAYATGRYPLNLHPLSAQQANHKSSNKPRQRERHAEALLYLEVLPR